MDHARPPHAATDDLAALLRAPADDRPYRERSLGATTDPDPDRADATAMPTQPDAPIAVPRVQRRSAPGPAPIEEPRPTVDAITASALPVQRRATAAGEWRVGDDGRLVDQPVQRRGSAATADDPAAIHAAAAHGTAGAATALPHLDTIQQAFGHHDVGGVRAHVDDAARAGAAAMGAEAFATGDHVAFAGAPSLHTAAHEAAHVVQQRAGVQLAGGVGAGDDPYERHADEVADQVVAGRSAEALLDRHAGAGADAATAGVQRRIRVDAIDGGAVWDPDIDFVQSTWGFSAAEKGIYRRWLKDDGDHRYATREAIKTAIKQVAAQPFGTDVAASYPDPAEQREIFTQALNAGYRVFDSAFTYETLPSLQAAATALAIPRDELTIIYKVKPADDTAIDARIGQLRAGPQNAVTTAAINQETRKKVSTRLDAARAPDGRLPDVLMLHDLDGDDAVIDANLRQLAAEITAGRARALGVSNATVFDLDRIRPIATAAGAPIRYVQNRFSPYHRDDDVVAYCAQHGIQYMAYGLMGSAQVGACAGVGDEGEGLPTQYQLARHDPRLKALAAQRGISEGELLLGWAQQRGVVPVSFTSRGDQAERNLARAAAPLPADLVQTLDEMFVAPSAGRLAATTSMAAGPLKSLLASYPDPTAWSIIDTLRAAAGGEALLTATAGAIVAAHADAEEQKAALKNFALNLVRHVGDIQSAIQRMQNERAAATKRNATRAPGQPAEAVPAVPFADWHAVLVPAFAQLAAAAGAPHVAQAFAAWAQRNCLAGHTMGHALEAWDELSRTPAPAPPAPAPQQAVAPAVAPPAAAPVVAPPRVVAYDEPTLTNEFVQAFPDAAAKQALAAGDEVYLGHTLYLVVSNDPARRELTVRPA